MLLSDEEDWRRVHGLRARCDAVLVGVGTVLVDDPSLRVKAEFHPAPARDPLRVVLDTHARTPPDARVVDGAAEGLVLHGPGVGGDWPACDQAEVPLDADGRLDLGAALDVLAGRGVRRVLVEGGGAVLRAFVQAGLCDVWTLYQAPVLVGGDGPQLWPGHPSGQGRRLHVMSVEPRGKGVLWEFRP